VNKKRRRGVPNVVDAVLLETEAVRLVRPVDQILDIPPNTIVISGVRYRKQGAFAYYLEIFSMKVLVSSSVSALILKICRATGGRTHFNLRSSVLALNYSERLRKGRDYYRGR